MRFLFVGYTTFPRSNPEWTENVGYNAAICAESFESLRVWIMLLLLLFFFCNHQSSCCLLWLMQLSLQIYPKKGNAVLFYNVLPDGQKAGIKDPMSLHGTFFVLFCFCFCFVLHPAIPSDVPVAGCDPVDSEKWAANFWLHLAPMRSFDAPQTYCVGEHCSP